MAPGNSKNYQLPENHQQVDRNEELIAAAKQLLVAAGYNGDAIVDGLSVASEQSPKKDDNEEKVRAYFIERE